MSTPPEPTIATILVGLDGCLSEQTLDHSIGAPVPAMVTRVKKWLAAEDKPLVLVFTARAAVLSSIYAVRQWLDQQDLQSVGITDKLPANCREIWHTHAIGVMLNKGISREDLIAYHMSRIMEAAGMKPKQGQPYGEAADLISSRIRIVLDAAKDIHAHLDSARDALDYLKPDMDPEQRETNLRQARMSLVRALGPLMRALE